MLNNSGARWTGLAEWPKRSLTELRYFVHTGPGKKSAAAQAKIATPNRLTAIETFVLRTSDRAPSTYAALLRWLTDAAARVRERRTLPTSNYQHRYLGAPHDFVSHTADQQTV